MNMSREVIIAALLAIMLGIGLGFASYSFIAEPPRKLVVRTLDLHTQRGGLGAGGFGGIFEQNETVQLSAYLTADSFPINQTEVSFTIRNPVEGKTVDTAITDSSGNARLDFRLPTDESAIGNWSVTAVAEVENETLSDSITLECQAKEVILPVQRAIDLYTQDGGLGANQPGGFFGPGGFVQLFVYLTAGGFPINQTEAVFTVSDPAGSESVQSALTDNSGIANVNITLPVEESALGNWSVTAVAQVENEALSDSLVFVCRIASLPIVTVRVLDVYTQRGGLGINESGGIFEQEEVVQLFAYLTANGSPINTTEVVFNVRDPNGNETVESALTDISGKAKINFTLPSDASALGNWSISAIAHVDNETVSDSMLFGCQKEVTPPVWRMLDLYTQRGGLGPDELGGFFGPGETVQLFAYLTGDGLPINQTEVAFTICHYGGSPVTDSALTDDLGIAKVNYTIPSGSSSVGNWSISAAAQMENETVSDSLFIGCGMMTASMLVTTKRYGVLSVNFNPMDSVTVDMHVYGGEYELYPVELNVGVLCSNGSYFLQQSVTTDMWGDASIQFQIPWRPVDGVIGYWHVYVSFEAYGRLIEACARFEVQLPPMVLDVHTQKDGYGPNVYGGSFLLGENVSLSAMILGILNESLIVDKLVSFEVRFNGTTVLVLTAQTDSTGVASVLFSVPQDPSFAGQWEVYARTEFYGQVLLDTLVFTVKQT